MPAIVQVNVGAGKPLFDKCIASVQEYALRHRMEHILINEPILKIKPKNSQRSKNALRLGYLPIYEKEYAFDLLETYDEIAIIDADVFIDADSPSVFANVDRPFAGCVEREMPLTKAYYNKVAAYSGGQYSPLKDVNWDWKDNMAHYYNMGVMLINRELLPYLDGLNAKAWVEQQQFEKFVNGEGQWRWSTDQTMLNYWVKKKSVPIQSLSWIWNALFGGIRRDQHKKAHFHHFFLSDHLPNGGMDLLDTEYEGHR